MKQSLKNYKKKIKSRSVDFYLHDIELYEFSKSINFSKFVKACLKAEMTLRKHYDEKLINEYKNVIINVEETHEPTQEERENFFEDVDDDEITAIGEIERLAVEGKLN